MKGGGAHKLTSQSGLPPCRWCGLIPRDRKRHAQGCSKRPKKRAA